MPTPEQLGREFADLIKAYGPRLFAGSTDLRYPPGVVKQIIDATKGLAEVEMAEGRRVAVPFGTFPPLVDRQYDVFTTRDERRWLKSVSEGADSAHWIRIMDRRDDFHPSGIRNPPDVHMQNAPSWDVDLRGFQSFATAYSGTDVQRDPSGNNYWFAVRGGVFYKCQVETGIVYSPPLAFVPTDMGQEVPSTHSGLPYVDPAYVGPTAATLTAATFGLSAFRVYLAAGTTFWRNQNDALARSEIRFQQVGTLPFVAVRLCPDPVDGNILYAAAANGAVARSIDRGATWATRGSIPLGSGWVLYGFGPGGAGQLVASGADGTAVLDFEPTGDIRLNNAAELSHFAWYVSKDGGLTWSTQQRLSDFTVVADTPIFPLQQLAPVLNRNIGIWFQTTNMQRPYTYWRYSPSCNAFQAWFQAYSDGFVQSTPPGNPATETFLQYGHANDLLASNQAGASCAAPWNSGWHVREFQFDVHPRSVRDANWRFA